MPSDSDRPIEKQLRKFAERRRRDAGAGAFTLHPVTRNALQVEVDREYGRRASGGHARSGWRNLFPNLLWGGGALALLAIMFVFAFAPGNKTELEPKAPLAAGGKVIPAVANNVSANAPALGMAAFPESQEFIFATKRVQTPLAVSRMQSPRTVESTLSGRTVSDSAVARAVPTVAPSSLAMPLQQSFRVTIVKDQITILDEDRSEYTGRLVAMGRAEAGSADKRMSFNERYYQALHGGASPAPVASQFVLLGTNRTSGLPVRIDGRMTTLTQAVTAAAAKSQPTPTSPSLQIQGTATVNGQTTVSIDASSEPQ